MSTQLDELIELIGRLGAEVRVERLGGSGGGLCRLKGKAVFFVDLDADDATRMERCLKGLAALPGCEGVYLSPVLRERLDAASAVRGVKPDQGP